MSDIYRLGITGTPRLTSLVDVSIQDPAQGQALTYSADVGTWVNTGLAPGPNVATGTFVTRFTPTGSDNNTYFANTAGYVQLNAFTIYSGGFVFTAGSGGVVDVSMNLLNSVAAFVYGVAVIQIATSGEAIVMAIGSTVGQAAVVFTASGLTPSNSYLAQYYLMAD